MFNKSLKVLSLVSAAFIVASCSFQMPTNNNVIKENNTKTNLKSNVKERMTFKTKSATTPIMAGLVPEGDSITVTLSGSPKVYKFYATSGKPYKVRLSQLDAKDAHLKIFKPSNNTTTPDFQNDNSTGTDSLVAFNASETGYWRIEASTSQAVNNNTDPTGAFELGLNDDSGFSHPCIAMDANGNFVIAWQEYGTDGSGWGVYARKFDKYGSPLGAPFRVNGTTAGDQKHPSVAISKNTGFFIITWEGAGTGDSTGIFMKRFNADTTPYDQAPYELRMNYSTSGVQANPSVIVGLDGVSVVTWQTLGSSDPVNLDGIWIGKMAANSTGSETQVNTFTSGYKSNPKIALNQGSTNYGEFVVVWQGAGNGDSEGIFHRKYNINTFINSNNFIATPENRVNYQTSGLQANPVVSMSKDSKYIFTWQTNGNGDSRDGIYGKLTNFDGIDITQDLRFNSTTSFDLSYPSVSINQNDGAYSGDYVISWQGDGTGDSSGVYRTRYNTANFYVLDLESRSNYKTNGVQNSPSVALNSNSLLDPLDGRFIKVWSTRGSTDNTDGIYAIAIKGNNEAIPEEGRISNAPPPPTTIIGGIK